MLHAMSRAFWPSSRQSIWLVTMTLSFTYSPTGSAFSIVLLVDLDERLRASRATPVVKHSTPRPMRAAFSNVPGLPAATHIGGCGSLYGFGSTLRGGIEKNLPSKLYSFSRHIFLNSGDDLVEHLLGQLGVVDAEAALLGASTSRGPCRTRSGPRDRWSSIATRSAMRAGWFTGGVMLKMPLPRWMRSVARGDVRRGTPRWPRGASTR